MFYQLFIAQEGLVSIFLINAPSTCHSKVYRVDRFINCATVNCLNFFFLYFPQGLEENTKNRVQEESR